MEVTFWLIYSIVWIGINVVGSFLLVVYAQKRLWKIVACLDFVLHLLVLFYLLGVV